MAWDKGRPVEGGLAPDLNDVIILNNNALEAALDAYIRFATGGTQTGQPRQGSARVYFQDAAPTARLDGDYFDSTDFGCIWVDSNATIDNQFNILTAADGAGTETWTPISTEIIAVLLAANRIFAGTLKSTGDFTVGANKVVVTAANGNTAVAGTLGVTGVATLGDGSALAAATETADGDRTIVDLAYAKTGDTIQHDAEGGYSNCDLDGTMTKVYTKYFSGSLDADSETVVAHGIADVDKILHVSAVVYSTGTSQYQAAELHGAASATYAYQLNFDATNVKFQVVGSTLQSQKYRIKIDYIL